MKGKSIMPDQQKNSEDDDWDIQQKSQKLSKNNCRKKIEDILDDMRTEKFLKDAF